MEVFAFSKPDQSTASLCDA